MRFPFCSSSPSSPDERIRLQAGAPDERVCLEHLPGLQRDPRRLDGADELADQDLDAALLERLLGVVPELRLEHHEELRRSLDQDDPRLLLRQVRVVLREVVPVELGERARALHPRRPAADDHHVDDPIVQETRVLVGGFPLVQDVLLEAHRVGERVHREGVLGSALGSEEVDLRTERRHEVVVGERCDLGELHLALVQVDRRDGCLVNGDVRLLLKKVAQGMSDRGGFEQGGGDLVEERLEGVVVVLVDQHDVDVGVLQFLCGAESRESSPEDQDARPLSRGITRHCHLQPPT